MRGAPSRPNPGAGNPAGACGSPFMRTQATNGSAQTAQRTRSRPAARNVPDQGPAEPEKSPPSLSPAIPSWANRETNTRTVSPQTTDTAAPTPAERGPLEPISRRRPAGRAASSPVKSETIEKESRTMPPETREKTVRPPMEPPAPREGPGTSPDR